jgi:hypothetical protein
VHVNPYALTHLELLPTHVLLPDAPLCLTVREPATGDCWRALTRAAQTLQRLERSPCNHVLRCIGLGMLGHYLACHSLTVPLLSSCTTHPSEPEWDRNGVRGGSLDSWVPRRRKTKA